MKICTEVNRSWPERRDHVLVQHCQHLGFRIISTAKPYWVTYIEILLVKGEGEILGSWYILIFANYLPPYLRESLGDLESSIRD